MQIYRVLGGRVLLIGASVYCGLYLWERLRWNATAKEQQFRRQLRQHLQVKLRYLQQMVIDNCDEQVKRYSIVVRPQTCCSDVSEVLNRLRATATELQKEMKDTVEKCAIEEEQLKKLIEMLNTNRLVVYIYPTHSVYSGEAVMLNSQIDMFESKYLFADTTS